MNPSWLILTLPLLQQAGQMACWERWADITIAMIFSAWIGYLIGLERGVRRSVDVKVKQDI